MYALILTLAAASASTAPPTQASGMIGSWLNPAHSLKVRTGPCGSRLCGWIIRASPQAMSDARAAGVANLVGTEVLQNFQPSGYGAWRGTAYVPDVGGSFSSRIRLLNPNSLEIRGCLIGSVLCRSQVWHRD